MSREQHGEDKFAEAAAMASKWDWFGLSYQLNQESAADLYKDAATQFKIAKNFQRAGEAFEQAAICSLAAESELDAMGHFSDAGASYAHVDPEACSRAYHQAIELYLTNDRFQRAAKLHEDVAKAFEEHGLIEQAIHEYEECVKLFETEHNENAANKRRIAIAHLCATIADYARAIELFEGVARNSLGGDTAGRLQSRTYLFKAMLCSLCLNGEANPQECRETLERYKGMTDFFSRSRECEFCERLVNVVIESDEGGFQDAFQIFSNGAVLPNWQRDMLQNVRQAIRERVNRPPDLDGDGLSPATVDEQLYNEPVGDAPLDENAPDI